MIAALSSDGWWTVAVLLWVCGVLGLAAFAAMYLRRPVEHVYRGDPRPPALRIMRRPPYDWRQEPDL